jgi:hypothetical protein
MKKVATTSFLCNLKIEGRATVRNVLEFVQRKAGQVSALIYSH